jgi:hypothetical protein
MVCDGSARQRWELTKDGQFRNRATDACLKAFNQPAMLKSGSFVELEACRPQPLWRWSFGA